MLACNWTLVSFAYNERQKSPHTSLFSPWRLIEFSNGFPNIFLLVSTIIHHWTYFVYLSTTHNTTPLCPLLINSLPQECSGELRNGSKWVVKDVVAIPIPDIESKTDEISKRKNNTILADNYGQIYL